MRFLIIRHAEPYYPTDSLTEKGYKEAELLSNRLVKEHITREGGVAFYADALFISKQYLAMIVKENVGKPISNFLSGARYEIAAQMLRDAKMSIQQVSDAMNFPDQSTFGKFFKRHSGMSPLQYQKSILKNLLINRGGTNL